jgi:hypothetical protein
MALEGSAYVEMLTQLNELGAVETPSIGWLKVKLVSAGGVCMYSIMTATIDC